MILELSLTRYRYCAKGRKGRRLLLGDTTQQPKPRFAASQQFSALRVVGDDDVSSSSYDEVRR